MTDAYRVDPEHLRAAARGFVDVADLLQRAEGRVAGVLDAAGPCWGDDESGQQFAAQYVPGATQTRAAFGQYTAALGEVERMLADMAATYTRADEGWASGFRGGAANP